MSPHPLEFDAAMQGLLAATSAPKTKKDAD